MSLNIICDANLLPDSTPTLACADAVNVDLDITPLDTKLEISVDKSHGGTKVFFFTGLFHCALVSVCLGQVLMSSCSQGSKGAFREIPEAGGSVKINTGLSFNLN